MAAPFAFFLLLFFVSHAAAADSTVAHHQQCSPTLSRIPQSAVACCADDCYPVDCAPGRHPVLSVSNISFSVLAAGLGFLNVSFLGFDAFHGSCRSSLPATQIDVSRSRFFFSNSTCNGLFTLRPACGPGDGCNRWHSELLRNPAQLLHGCRNRLSSPPPCSANFFKELTYFLQSGMQLRWKEEELSPYFSSCEYCEHMKCNNTGSPQGLLCFKTRKKPAKSAGRAAVVATVFAASSLLLLVAGAAAILKWKGRTFFGSDLPEEDPANLFLHHHHSSSSPLPPAFTYEELEASTNKFDARRKLGDGGFGAVYLGHLRDGRAVAVKRLHRRHATKSFSNEVFILASIDHPNLLRLHGYCCDRRGLLLVYDYLPNGTLADHLHRRKGSFPWPVRVETALQVAMAIEYLHHSLSPAVVHRDITTNNIFVDKDMAVRVGDFGLSRLLVFTESSPSCVWTGPQGTPGYLDPDYHRSSQLTEKSDVYSFGVVLMELVTGLRAVDLGRDKREVALADLVVGKILAGKLEEVVDGSLKAEAGANVMETVRAVAELAFRCVAGEKDDRPDAREVAAELRRIRALVRGH